MNPESFLKDRGVPYHTVGQELFFDCPFCGDTRKRFYWNRVSGYTYCHNCEWRSRSLPRFIAEYEGISFEVAERMLQSESSTGMRGLRSRLTAKAAGAREEVHIELPLGFRPLTREKTRESLPYWHYLTKVRDIPEHVVIEYGIGYTQLGKYAWRVIIPILFEGRLVSWVARDATGKAERKVLTPYGNQ
jgi:hypothetical protein